MTDSGPAQPVVSAGASSSSPGGVLRRRVEGVDCWVNRRVAEASGVGEDAMLDGLLRIVMLGDFEPEQRFKADHRSEVVRFVWRDRSWVLKRYRTPGVRTRLLHGVRYSPAWREWRAARCLVARGILGCLPLALIHEPGRLGCAQSLILPHMVGDRLDEILRRAESVEGLHRAERCWRLRLARAIGRQAGLLSRAGLANRDHKPTNLLIDGASVEEAGQPILIDPAGLRRRWTQRAVWRMLAQLRRTAGAVGPISLREELACLRAALRADPSLAGGGAGRLRRAAGAVERTRCAAGRSSDGARDGGG